MTSLRRLSAAQVLLRLIGTDSNFQPQDRTQIPGHWRSFWDLLRGVGLKRELGWRSYPSLRRSNESIEEEDKGSVRRLRPWQMYIPTNVGEGLDSNNFAATCARKNTRRTYAMRRPTRVGGKPPAQLDEAMLQNGQVIRCVGLFGRSHRDSNGTFVSL